MSQFKLGGVPDHAYDGFYKLRDKVSERNGREWSRALGLLLQCTSPEVAIERLNNRKVLNKKG